MEELQQERQKHELQTRLLSGERWRPGLRSSLAHALGTRVVELLLRAAVSADIQANFNHSVSNGTHKSGRNECLSEELKFIEVRYCFCFSHHVSTCSRRESRALDANSFAEWVAAAAAQAHCCCQQALSSKLHVPMEFVAPAASSAAGP